MHRSRLKYLLPSFAFVILEIILSVMLQISSGRESALYSIISISLAAVFFIIFFSLSYEYVFTQIGLICTLFADFFLVWTIPQERLTAMLFFSVTQIAYFLRIYLKDNDLKRKKIHLILRASILVLTVAVTFIVLKEKTDALSIVSMIYYVNLILNMVFAFIQFKKLSVLAFGLLLFLLCDTVVGLSMIGAYIPISSDSLLYKIIFPGFNLAWVFYVPSQILIALSLLQDKIKK